MRPKTFLVLLSAALLVLLGCESTDGPVAPEDESIPTLTFGASPVAPGTAVND